MSAFDDAFNLLVSKFPRRYNVKTTRFLKGLLEAIATGDAYVESQVEATRDNLIAVTASGPFLDRAASRYGIVRGEGTGILDPDFQNLIPTMGLSPKQVSHILLKIIDVFYGPFASHANVVAANSQPYSLFNNAQLIVRLDDTQETINFTNEDAIDITNATSAELATAISQKTNGRIVGSTLIDARTGQQFLNIRTSTIGSQGFISVIGGDAQITLQFPSIRLVTNSIAIWDVQRYLGTDEMVYSVVGGVGPNLAAAGIMRGDTVTIRSTSGFLKANTGTFRVSQVGLTSFRLVNPNGFRQINITQAHADDFIFYHPNLGNVLSSARPAAIVETLPRQLTIILPVTSPIVKRTILGGHHFHQGVASVLATTSNTVTIGSSLGFVANGAFKKAIARNFTTGVISTVGGSTINLINAQNWPNFGAIWVANTRQFYYFSGRTGNQLTGVTPTPPGSIAGENANYTERYKYTTITGNVLNGVYPDPSSPDLMSQTIFAAGANTGTNFPGSFLYDPDATFTPASQLARTGQDIRQGSVITLLQLDNVSAFPTVGQVVVEFGTNKQEGPIRFLAKVGTTGLIMDPSHVFQFDHMAGVGLRLVGQLGPYTPRVDGTDLAAYTTSTSPARDLLRSYLQLIAASGVSLNFVIRVPDQKWPVLPNLYTTLPLSTTL